jgi:glycosyltransferase involved in cell wall biosynthesis
MKIAIIFDAKSKGGGGFFQSLNSSLLLNKLNNKKNKISFITFDRTALSKLKIEGLDAILFKNTLLLKIFFHLKQINIFKFFFKFFKFKNSFSSFLKKNKFDFIVFLGPSWFIRVCDDHNFVSTIYDINFKLENYFPEYRSKNIFKDKDQIVSDTVNYGFKILVDTKRSKRELVEIYNCPERKIVIQPFIPLLPTLQKKVDSANELKLIFNLGLKDKNFLFYPAQFWAHKNHKYIIDAVEILNRKKNDIKIVFCGADKSNLYYIKETINKKKLNNSFFIFDFISDEEIIALYKNCMALVMPTYVARSTLPLYEAFYFKKPIFYSKNILDEDLEKLIIPVDLYNPEDLSNKILELKSDINFGKEKILKASRYYNDNCHEEIFLKNYQNIFNEYEYLSERWKK